MSKISLFSSFLEKPVGGCKSQAVLPLCLLSPSVPSEEWRPLLVSSCKLVCCLLAETLQGSIIKSIFQVVHTHTHTFQFCYLPSQLPSAVPGLSIIVCQHQFGQVALLHCPINCTGSASCGPTSQLSQSAHGLVSPSLNKLGVCSMSWSWKHQALNSEEVHTRLRQYSWDLKIGKTDPAFCSSCFEDFSTRLTSV